mmetsp:Transcript_978/g.2376  ORF Transcript_978/g.2376 Transcript_978/m.2376 type:complete len:225 (-) Transcript_978:503-1177(-)
MARATRSSSRFLSLAVSRRATSDTRLNRSRARCFQSLTRSICNTECSGTWKVSCSGEQTHSPMSFVSEVTSTTTLADGTIARNLSPATLCLSVSRRPYSGGKRCSMAMMSACWLGSMALNVSLWANSTGMLRVTRSPVSPCAVSAWDTWSSNSVFSLVELSTAMATTRSWANSMRSLYRASAAAESVSLVTMRTSDLPSTLRVPLPTTSASMGLKQMDTRSMFS